MKSSWAYNNGKRMMRECKPKVPAFGFIMNKRKSIEMYAERTLYGLMIKTYSNKKQVDNKVAKLKEIGLNVERTLMHPYVIVKIAE